MSQPSWGADRKVEKIDYGGTLLETLVEHRRYKYELKVFGFKIHHSSPCLPAEARKVKREVYERNMRNNKGKKGKRASNDKGVGRSGGGGGKEKKSRVASKS